ncbi:hypothetical protein [Tsuneonella sp. HG222]
MAIESYIVEEGPGRGRGHTQHGNGKGLGHLKHGDEAMSDGYYTMAITGIDHDNPTGVSETSPLSTLADGSQMNTEVREGRIATVDGPAGGDDNGALLLETDSNNGRLRVNTLLDSDQQVSLGDLDQLSFEYYVDSSDRSDVTPVLRLFIDADGDLATTADRGELVFEYAYQGDGPVTQDTWQTADLAGDDWTAWQRSGGENRDQIVNMTELSDWADADGFTPAGGLNFNEDSIVLAWSVAYGSGNGTGVLYLDDLQVGGVQYDFVV